MTYLKRGSLSHVNFMGDCDLSDCRWSSPSLVFIPTELLELLELVR